MSGNAALLPFVDEHATVVAAPPMPVWEALLRAVEGMTAGAASGRFARLLGCADTAVAGPRPLAIDAVFPGLKGRAYRTLVIGTRMHVLVTNRVLDSVRRRAER